MSPAERAEALKFLVHFVGDLHQPLHATDNRDRGGNDVHVSFARGPNRPSTNLHAFWDTEVIQGRGLGESEYAALVERGLESRQLDPGPIDFVRWAVEAHEAASKFAYAYPDFSALGPPQGVVSLDSDYVVVARSVVDKQIGLAGIRLAALLNEVFATETASRSGQSVGQLVVAGRTLPMRVGEFAQLTATFTGPTGSSDDVTGQAAWQSGNPQIVTVSPTGMLSAVAGGVATIRVFFAGTSSNLAVTVVRLHEPR